MPPSILENIQQNYNLRSTSSLVNESYDNDRYNYTVGTADPTVSLYGGGGGGIHRKKDYQDNYGEYGGGGGVGGDSNTTYMQQSHDQQQYMSSVREMDYAPGTPNLNQTRGINYLHHTYDKQQQRPTYLMSSESPYMSSERVNSIDMLRDKQYGLTSPPVYGGGGDSAGESMNSVHSMLKNDYQVI